MHGGQAVVAGQLDALAPAAAAPLHRERAHRHALADPLPRRHRSLRSAAEVCCLGLVAVTRVCSGHGVLVLAGPALSTPLVC